MTVIGALASILRFLSCGCLKLSSVPQNLTMLAARANGMADCIVSATRRPNVLLLDNSTNCDYLVDKVINMNVVGGNKSDINNNNNGSFTV